MKPNAVALLFCLMMMISALAGCIGGTDETTGDDDFDGIMNDVDICPTTPTGALVGTDGCELPDADGDGVTDVGDQCPNTPANATVDATGCEVNADADADGVSDDADQCLNTPANATVDATGCEVIADSDGDGVTDAWDSFPNDNTEWHDNDNDSIGDNLDTDDDNDGVVDTLDMFPNATGYWIDIDGDGTPHNGNDPNGWLNSSGIGAMRLNYVMVGFVDGHESYWISDSPDCPCYAYYYTSTPDIIWTDGHGSSIESVSNLPNVEKVLSAMGMGLENLSTSTETMNLGTDTEGVEWTYDNDTRIEWRNYSSTTSTMYLDDIPIFHVNTSLEMYLDYTNLMFSMGQNPVELWGESSVSPIYQFGEESYNLMTKTLYQAFVYDLGENGLNYSFESQNSIIQNTYTWDANEPANKTTLLESVLQQTDSPMHAGLYDSITTNLTEQQPEEENQTLMTSSRSYSSEGTTYRDD